MFFPTSWWWQTVFRARLFPVGHYCAEAIFFPWADSKIWADSAKVIARSFRILNPNSSEETVEHVSRWRKTVLAPELRLLVNEQIYTGSPIDSEWQTKRAHTHTTSIDCWRWGFGLAMRHQTLRFEEKQLSMCHGDDKQCWHQSWDFWSMSRFTLALQLILSDKARMK
jgi:hypothetical protein